MEEFRSICKNQWCKVPFFYKESEMAIDKEFVDKNKGLSISEIPKIAPKECPKCRSFANELSGGVEWKDKQYEGSRFDNIPHQIKYKVTNYR